MFNTNQVAKAVYKVKRNITALEVVIVFPKQAKQKIK
jgi:hypothetical protein